MFSFHTPAKARIRHCQIPSGLKSVLEKLGFRDGLVWTVDQNIERNKASDFPGVVWLLPYTASYM